MTHPVKKRDPGFFCLLAGGVFLWNPVVGLIDVLPDAIGYFLLCAGLLRLSDLNDTLAECFEKFRRLIWVGIAQIFSEWFVYGYLAGRNDLSEYELPMTVLVFSFVFAAVEWYYLLPALRGLFRGLGELAVTSEGSLTGNVRGTKKTPWERLGTLSTVLAVAIPLCALLPELTILSATQGNAGRYSFLILLRAAFAVLAGLIGLWWLIRYLLFFIRALRDTAWSEFLANRYEREILPQTELLAYRRFSVAFAFLLIGTLCFPVLRLDGMNIFPGFLSAAFLTVGLLLTGTGKKIRGFLFPAVLLAAAGVGSLILTKRYLADYLPADARFLPEAYRAFLPVQLTGACEAILSALLTVLLFRAVRTWIAAWILPGHECDAEKIRRYQSPFYKKANFALALFLLSSAGTVADAFLQPYFSWFWWIPLLCAAVAFAVTLSLFGDLRAELHDRIPERTRADV